MKRLFTTTPATSLRLFPIHAQAILFMVTFAGALVISIFALAGSIPGDTTHESPTLIKRIISMAPSLTEMVFALGADSLLVGVTRYCKYPPEAESIDKIGGFLDPNYEVIVEAQPDLVLLLKEHDKPKEMFAKLEIATVTVDHQSVDGIIASFGVIGKKLGATKRSDSLVAVITNQIRKFKIAVYSLEKPTTLICIGHSPDSGAIKNLYVAGDERFYSEMIALAGGRNALTEGEGIKFPILSAESVSKINPEVIIDIFPDIDGSGLDTAFVLSQWRSLPGVSAIENKRVYPLKGNYLVIPGPRFVQIIRKFAKALHPDAEF
ncbi:MAG: ABC transporter substrate-binding protein [candidate division Zixibacteria bacterium]|nr:ABC transporter substrate-binding protein [candidate division Zixibacteria bacterium]